MTAGRGAAMYRVVVGGASESDPDIAALADGQNAWRLEWARRADDLPGAVDDGPPSLIVVVPAAGHLGRWLDALATCLPESADIPVMALLAGEPPETDLARLSDVGDFELAPWRLGDVRLRIGRLMAAARARSVGETCGRLA